MPRGAKEFQTVLDLMRQWWLLGLRVNGQLALAYDGGQEKLIPYVAAYCSKPEWSVRFEMLDRGKTHFHLQLMLAVSM